MGKPTYRQLLRQARHLARQQQAALLALEVEGIVALTLHSATRSLTIAVERPVGAQLAGELTEALHSRRQALRAQLRQLPPDAPGSPAGESVTPLPP